MEQNDCFILWTDHFVTTILEDKRTVTVGWYVSHCLLVTLENVNNKNVQEAGSRSRAI